MLRIFAIAGTSIRTSIRSRGFTASSLLFMGALLSLLLMLRDDGTAKGFLSIVIVYPSSFLFFLISIAVVWSGSSSIADEVSSKTIQLIATKPVSAIELWAGKWLGLMAINTALLLIGHAIIAGFIANRVHGWQTTDPSKFEEAQRYFVARSPLYPSSETAGPVPVHAGQAAQWRFEAGDLNSAVLGYSLLGSSLTQQRSIGDWQLQGTDSQDANSFKHTSMLGRWSEIYLAPGMAQSSKEWLLQYRNEDPSGATVVFTHEGRPRLLIPAASLPINYVRMLLIDWCRLAILSALAIFAGSLFSLPVAGLVSFFFLIHLYLAPLLPSLAEQHNHAHHHDEDGSSNDHSAAIEAYQWIAGGISAISRPLAVESGARAVAEGRYIEDTFLHRALFLGIGGPVAMAGFSAFCFRRRELGRPSD